MAERHRPTWYTGPDDPHLDIGPNALGIPACRCGRVAPLGRLDLLAYVGGCTLLTMPCDTCGGFPVCEPDCPLMVQLIQNAPSFLPPPGWQEEIRRRAQAELDDFEALLIERERELVTMAQQLGIED